MWLANALILYLTFGTSNALAVHLNCVTSDDKLGHRFVANCDGIDQYTDGTQIHFRHNKMGLRDKDYSENPAKDRYRVLFIGSSIALNYDMKNGLVPSVEKHLNELLNSSNNAKASLKYKKVEIISAAEAAYHLVKTNLRLPELLSAYNPDTVILLEPSLEGLLTEELLDGYRATEKDPTTGLATKIGKKHSFWPLPREWEPKIWAYPWARRLEILSIALQIAILKFKLHFFPKLLCGQDQSNCLLDKHFKYLYEIKKQAVEKNAMFIYLYVRPSSLAGPRDPNAVAWYNPEWIASRFVPLEDYSEQDINKYENYLQKSLLSFLDISKLMLSALELQKKSNPSEYHFGLESSEFVGKKLADQLFPVLLPNLKITRESQRAAPVKVSQ